MTAIVDALVAVRARTGLTDDALARVVGVKQATFTRWRNGTLSVHPRHAGRLAALLALPTAEVVRLISDQPDGRAANPIEKGTVGWVLRQFERREGLTVQGAYERLGVEVSAYHKWRKNQVVPGPAAIAGLAAGMGVSEQSMVMAVYRTELWRLSQKG